MLVEPSGLIAYRSFKFYTAEFSIQTAARTAGSAPASDDEGFGRRMPRQRHGPGKALSLRKLTDLAEDLKELLVGDDSHRLRNLDYGDFLKPGTDSGAAFA